MAHNEMLTQRIRQALAHLDNVQEKKIFRGVTFMINNKMCFSTGDHRLMCRIDPSIHDEIVKIKSCETMLMKGKKLRGWLYVNERNLKSEKELIFWIGLVLNYNKSLQQVNKNK